jgi:hypothetical protein
MSNFLTSSKTKAIMWIIFGIVILLLVFGLGVTVGYKRAIFASQFGENYYHNFYGGPHGTLMGSRMMGGAPIPMHGVTGEVLQVMSSTISIKDSRGNEDIVAVSSNTPIREMDTTVTIDDIDEGSGITVIGEPNGAGQIQARFIRLFEASPILPN